MRAALLHEPNSPLKIEEIDMPEISSDEVLVQIKACGICHGDVYLVKGERKPSKWPIVPGHEASGIIVEKGDNVTDFGIGDRVVLYPLLTCNRCSYCLQGRENLCINARSIGKDVDGAFAEYIKIPQNNVFKLGNSISFEEGGILTDALATPFHAINRANIKMGDTVVIFGLGGLGMSALQILNLLNVEIIAVEISERKLEIAEEFGISEGINPRKVDVVRKIKELTGKGADVAIELVGSPVTMEQAIQSVKLGGRVVIVGYTTKSFSLEPYYLMGKEIEIIGSRWSLRSDLIKLIELAEKGMIDPGRIITHKFHLEDINEGIRILEEQIGDPIRVVLTML